MAGPADRFHDPQTAPAGPTGSEGISVIFNLPPKARELYKAAPEHVTFSHSAGRSIGSLVNWLLALRRPLIASGAPVSRRRSRSRLAAGLEREADRPGERIWIEREIRRERGRPGGKIEGSVRRKLMRLLSFVPCGCRAGPIDDAPPADHAGDTAGAARRRRRRRRRAAAQWRPSLGDIYEEYDSTDAAAKAARAAAGPVRARKAASWDVARVLPRAHSDEYRHLGSSSSMPAFAPTAYLF